MSALASKLRADPSTSSLPTYSSATDIELTNIPSSTSTSTSSLPPTYDDATAASSSHAADAESSAGAQATAAAPSFTPTVHLQIETSGKQWLSLPTGTRPDPVPVYRVEAGSWAPDSTPAYVSLRFSRNDGSCQLVRGDDESQTPVCTTLYRFGPGKPPNFRLPQSLISPHTPPAGPDQRRDGEVEEEEEIDGLDLKIASRSITSRTQLLKTPLGTFQWRYASRKERAAVPGADDLLVCEIVETAALAGGRKTEETTTRVAQLVRGEGTRSMGSGRSTAGNGGRLMVDLARWADLKGGGREAVEVLVVASCVCMLKKEVDRRRMQQIMIMAGGAGGG